jgi:hypothetical protein
MASSLDRLAHNLLRTSLAVIVCGIDIVYALVQGILDNRHGSLFIDPPAKGVASKANLRNPE